MTNDAIELALEDADRLLREQGGEINDYSLTVLAHALRACRIERDQAIQKYHVEIREGRKRCESLIALAESRIWEEACRLTEPGAVPGNDLSWPDNLRDEFERRAAAAFPGGNQ